jgi:arylsulfatase
MIDHDKCIGEMLDFLDRARHRGQHLRQVQHRQRPAHEHLAGCGHDPYRNEKNSSWEGAYRIPAWSAFPARSRPGSESNEVISHLDWFPTILAAAGEPDIKGKLKKGHKIGNRPTRSTSTATTWCRT